MHFPQTNNYDASLIGWERLIRPPLRLAVMHQLEDVFFVGEPVDPSFVTNVTEPVLTEGGHVLSMGGLLKNQHGQETVCSSHYLHEVAHILELKDLARLQRTNYGLRFARGEKVVMLNKPLQARPLKAPGLDDLNPRTVRQQTRIERAPYDWAGTRREIRVSAIEMAVLELMGFPKSMDLGLPMNDLTEMPDHHRVPGNKLETMMDYYTSYSKTLSPEWVRSRWRERMDYLKRLFQNWPPYQPWERI